MCMCGKHHKDTYLLTRLLSNTNAYTQRHSRTVGVDVVVDQAVGIPVQGGPALAPVYDIVVKERWLVCVR